MSDLAAMHAQLVDVRNIGHNKAVRLTLHVDASAAPQVLEIFGWPTSAEPVPVAIARLNETPGI